MKSFIHLRMAALVAVALLGACLRTEAQGFGLSVTASSPSILVNNPVTYTIFVTNLTELSLEDAQVTNTLPSSVLILSTNTSQGIITVSGSVVVFDLGQFTYPGIAEMTVTAEPTVVGYITNTVAVSTVVFPDTNTVTNVVIQVTNAVLEEADLGVAITGPVQAVITNDWTTYTVTATNLGPDVATNVVLTNTLPPGVILLGVSPTNKIYTISSSNLIFNLGTLTNGGGTNLQFTVEPTNAGVLTLSASIGATGNLDPDTTNNFASTNITVMTYLPGMLQAIISSAQTIDLQNGLLEQSILLSNIGTTNVPAARIVVTGLTNRLFNAVGTNSGAPFVYYSAPLAVGQSVNLLLQYTPRNLFPFTNGQLQAFAVPLPDWTPPVATPASTNINIKLIVRLPDGNMLIEWPAVTDRSYTVVYSDNLLFSNAMIAPPAIVGTANEMQWIDYGPPTTVSAVTNSSARFYRVIQNP